MMEKDYMVQPNDFVPSLIAIKLPCHYEIKDIEATTNCASVFVSSANMNPNITAPKNIECKNSIFHCVPDRSDHSLLLESNRLDAKSEEKHWNQRFDFTVSDLYCNRPATFLRGFDCRKPSRYGQNFFNSKLDLYNLFQDKAVMKEQNSLIKSAEASPTDLAESSCHFCGLA